MPVRRFHVTVLVARGRVRLLHHQTIVSHQFLVAPGELALVGEVVYGCAQPIGAMPLGDAAQFPQGILQSFAQALEAFREADRHRLPVRVGQDEVIRQVLERLAGDGHAQVVHRSEVRGAQPAGEVLLREENLLGRARRRPPLPHAPLQRPHLARLEAAWILALQPLEQRLGLECWFSFQLRRHLLPHAVERVRPRSPIARLTHLAGKLPHVSVPPCCLAIHAGLVCRSRQRLPSIQKTPKALHLTIRDPGHRKLLILGLAIVYARSSERAQLRGGWGIVIVVSGEK